MLYDGIYAIRDIETGEYLQSETTLEKAQAGTATLNKHEFNMGRTQVYRVVKISQNKLIELQKGIIKPKYQFEGKTIDVDLFGTIFKVILKAETYETNGRIAIEGYTIEDDLFEPFSTLTTNLPMAYLDDDEICVKDWSENEQFAKACLESGYFLETGRTIPTGFVNAPVWKLLKESEG
jgi:hypothetical protein